MALRPTDEHLAFLIEQLRRQAAACIAEADTAPDEAVWTLCERGSVESDAADALEAVLLARRERRRGERLIPPYGYHDGPAVRIRFG